MIELWYRLFEIAGGDAEVAAQDDFEFKLKVYIDSTVDKRFVLVTLLALSTSICCFSFPLHV